MKKIIFLLSLLSSVYTFGQCDEYYINELISGPEERQFPSGGEMRFCPELKGVSLNDYTFDVSQWTGISTQYLTLTKNGGIAGNLVLSLNERTLKVNFIGSPGVQVYSIFLTKKELNEVKKKKDDLTIQSIDSCMSINEFEKARDFYSNLYEKANYTHSSELFDKLNKLRKENLETLIPKIEEAIKDKQWIIAAKLYSDIKGWPTNSTYTEISKSTEYRNMIENELKTIYKDSVIFLDVNFQFSTSKADFEINGKNISFDKAIQNYLDSLSDGEYFIKISQNNDYVKSLNYELGRLISGRFIRILKLPSDQSECMRWQYGGGCAEYYNANLLDGFTKDSLEQKQFGIFNISTPNYLKLKFQRKFVNPQYFYYTSKGEKLKKVNDNYYRKVKGEKSITIKTDNENVQLEPNTLIIASKGQMDYIINDSVNYSVQEKIYYTKHTIQELFSKAKN